MAAAEYYSNAPMGPTPQQSSPYTQPQYNQSQLAPSQQSLSPQIPTHPPPPYQSVNADTRPSVHFEDRPSRPPPRPHRQSHSSQAPIPVVADPQRPSILKPTPSPQLKPSSQPPSFTSHYPPHAPQVMPTSQPPSFAGNYPQPASQFNPSSLPQSLPGNYHQPPPQSKPSSQPQSFTGVHIQPPPRQQQPYPQPHLHPHPQQNPQLLSPYSHANHSQYSVGGYASDPERHRRRRRRHSDGRRESSRERHRTDREVRGEKPRQNRSRSTNADGFLGAAGGGLIGDLIFPGLGTVGGALAGWIGGKDYGKHRKYREEKLDHDQHRWEHKYSRDDERRGHSPHGREQRSNDRHRRDY